MTTPAFEDIAADLEFLDDWEDRYRHVIELGKAMPPLSEAERSPEYKVEGCVSQVWIVPEVEGEGPGAIFRFRGDSDAMIVRGLIAILHALLSDRPVREVAEEDVAAQLARLGLDSHLPAQRSNGLRAMVRRIQGLARAAMAAA
ncbi:MAG: SufE family protein [Alphaproteobacteria bacterium]|nr:MAG: SufE family protein [Alphaproteobacteria bacterium]